MPMTWQTRILLEAWPLCCAVVFFFLGSASRRRWLASDATNYNNMASAGPGEIEAKGGIIKCICRDEPM